MAEERKPKYKVGDTITIKQLSMRDYCGGDYRFGLNGEMADLAGKSYTIMSIELAECAPGKIPDDGYRYKLEGEIWSWASSMFEDSDSSIDAFIRKRKRPELDFNL